MRIITIINQKGGCGKTTTAINLASLYAKRGLRTLLIDMDPQSHCAAGLGVPESRIEYSIGDALLATHDHRFDADALLWEVSRNLYLAPSTVMLSALEAPGGGLHQLADKDRRLESLLALLKGRFDRCLIDCPPTIGLLTFNAMRAAREAIIPVETGFFSLKGAERQWNTIQRLIAHIGRPLACHLLATLHNPRSTLACNILAALRRQFAGQIAPVVIHEHEVLREAASFGQPIVEYAPDSEARADFDALADWLEEHAAKPAMEIEVTLPPSGFDPHAMPGIGPSTATAPDAPGTPAAAESRVAELLRRMQAMQQSARAMLVSDAMGGPGSDGEAQSDGQRLAPAAAVLDAAGPTQSTAQAVTATRSVLVEAPAPAAELVAPDLNLAAELTHLYGVRQTRQGVLFVQPAKGASSMAIAGEFNHWSPTATPLRFNGQLGVFETIVKLSPGTWQYRLVIDGQWVADSYNSLQQLNSYGEPNSVVTVL